MVNILCRLHHNNASRKVRDRETNYCLYLYTFIKAQYLHNKSGKFYFKQSELEDNHFLYELFQFLFVFHCSAQCSLQIARHVNGHLMDCLHT